MHLCVCRIAECLDSGSTVLFISKRKDCSKGIKQTEHAQAREQCAECLYFSTTDMDRDREPPRLELLLLVLISGSYPMI